MFYLVLEIMIIFCTILTLIVSIRDCKHEDVFFGFLFSMSIILSILCFCRCYEDKQIDKQIVKYSISESIVDTAIKQGYNKEEVIDIFSRCSELGLDPAFGFQLLDPTLTDEQAEALVVLSDKENEKNGN